MFASRPVNPILIVKADLQEMALSRVEAHRRVTLLPTAGSRRPAIGSLPKSGISNWGISPCREIKMILCYSATNPASFWHSSPRLHSSASRWWLQVRTIQGPRAQGVCKGEHGSLEVCPSISKLHYFSPHQPRRTPVTCRAPVITWSP